MRCFAWRKAAEHRWEPCGHEAVRQFADQYYCGFHAEAIRAAALDSFEVYYLERDGLIKIGVSRDPEERARDLKARLLATELGGRARERELHYWFVEARVRGEWFAPVPGLLEVIEEARARSDSRAGKPEAVPASRGTEA